MSDGEALLSLDLAGQLGWAAFREGWSGAKFGTVKLPDVGKNEGLYFDRYASWLEGIVLKLNPCRVIYEKPWHGPNTHQTTAAKLYGLAAMTQRTCHQLEAPYCFELVSVVRQHFIGKSRLPRGQAKAAVMAQCKLIGWHPQTQDEADALAQLDYYAALRRVNVPWPRTALQAAAISLQRKAG